MEQKHWDIHSIYKVKYSKYISGQIIATSHDLTPKGS